MPKSYDNKNDENFHRFLSFEDEIEIEDSDGNKIDIRGTNRIIKKPKE